ncbi:polyribonucleotide nucleotidyltransferase [endosymbiont GvMRE of Glomus versiforme]|uniref:polyribonucleotide nucleotidyltransferase n=1 Tax=endosymbiont GvMRE of Glomus versiforme TaxID=2039283 RepID=UPI000EC5E70F|nr:polyribonucleotide nucleotidyltransferase [endosymbiont GvMRE of Glomus versiforme]RHZ35396.1 Polyribonucleotide nucleotidyltransferase [endosymbiont GvMRE of Glomus versiforme]
MSKEISKKAFFSRLKNRFEFNFNGKQIIFEIDCLASKSDKSIICRYGNTTVLTTLTIKRITKDVYSFFPLAVSFEEKFYAIGRIPNVFGRREGKPSYDAITTARLIDRSLRSFFPSSSQQEVQIVNSVLSLDSEYDPRIVSAWNSFLVCYLCPSLPFFSTPLAAVIVSQEEKNFICNPSNEKLNSLPLELIVSATKEKIVMIEARAQEIDRKELEKAVEFAHQEIQTLIEFFQNIANTLNVKKKTETKQKILTYDKWLEEEGNIFLSKIISATDLSWIEKEKKMKEVRQELTQKYHANNPQLREETVKNLVERIWDSCLRNWMRKLWKEKQVRLDGRKADQIRPLEIQIDYLPNVHGSAVFARGETKVLSVITIGKISEKQLVDSIFNRSYKHFIHHYNFPSFAVNEIVSHHNISRREIGHGELVKKTFDHLIPSSSLFPYTIRAVSEVFSSDGSSSQASICATSLSLMTTGVPLIRPAAGIALGLFEGQVYSDINGLEDKLGEMDFKIAGTEKGICSLQLDIKNEGISKKIIKECLEKSSKNLLCLLKEMKVHIPCSREYLPTNVIKCRKFYVEKNKIGLIVGVRGKNISQITEKFNSTIEIQENGWVLVYNREENALEETYQTIKRMVGPT